LHKPSPSLEGKKDNNALNNINKMYIGGFNQRWGT